jgi:DNA-binding NarL/FixJ family response regulator
VASALIRDYVERARRGEVVARTLTPREAEVVKLVAEANTNEEIAQLLVISRKTVERHRANVLEKLGVRDRGPAHALCDPTRVDRAVTVLSAGASR